MFPFRKFHKLNKKIIGLIVDAIPRYFCSGFFMFFIFLPQVIYCSDFLLCKKIPEPQNSRLNLVQISHVGFAHSESAMPTFKDCYFIDDNVVKFGGSIIKLFSPVSAQGEMIPKPNAGKKDYDTESRMRDYTDKELNDRIVQCFYAFLFALLFVFGAGYLLIFAITKFVSWLENYCGFKF